MYKQSFDNKWKFTFMEPYSFDPGPIVKPEVEVTLPHDFIIGLDKSPGAVSGCSTGYYPGGIGVYIKRFFIPSDWADKHVLLEFEGAYWLTDVKLNNHNIKKNYFGYNSFLADLTDKMICNAENEITVTVKNSSEPSARWYCGGGLYRHVNLLVSNKLHIRPYGIFVHCTHINKESAWISLDVEIQNLHGNSSCAYIKNTIYDATDHFIASEISPITIKPSCLDKIRQKILVPHPKLWSLEDPYLYKLITEIYIENVVIDSTVTDFGIRTITVDREYGMLLNGKPIKLYGACIHSDNGILGSCSFDKTEDRKIRLLKEAGFNSIRAAHNPVSQAVLSACDKLGVLVMNESFDCWLNGKPYYDSNMYFEFIWKEITQNMVLNSRNHPSVIMYSIGNEVAERDNSSDGGLWARAQVNAIRELDTTRPVTCALCTIMDPDENDLIPKKGTRAGMDRMSIVYESIQLSPSWGHKTHEVASALDVVGYNYMHERYEPDGEIYPNRVIVGSENYVADIDKSWELVKKLPYVIGDFTWTGWDYIGEAGIGHFFYEGEEASTDHALGQFPWTTAYCGDFDICGFRRPQSYYREIVYGKRDRPFIGVYDPSRYNETAGISVWSFYDVYHYWAWPGYEGKPIEIDVYSPDGEMELFVNGKSLGKKHVGYNTRYIAKYHTVYEPGELTAVYYKDDVVISREILVTPGKATKILAIADRSELTADEQDLSYITLLVADDNDRIVPHENITSSVEVTGAGSLIGLGTGNPKSKENYTATDCTFYQGRALAVVRSTEATGSINVRLQSSLGVTEISLKAIRN